MRNVLFILVLSAFLINGCNSRTETEHESQSDESARLRMYEQQKVNKSETNPENAMTENKNKVETSLPTVSLDAKAETSESELIIRYEVKNHADQSIYLWDRMIGYNGPEQTIDSGSVYVFYQAPDTMRVIAGVLPLPENRDVGRKEIPYAREFPGNGKLSGEIKLRVPVNEFSPYYEPFGKEDHKKVEITQIRLMVGWTEPRNGMKITERKIGGEDVIAIRGGWESPYHRIVERIIPVKLDLLIYESDFERQMPLQ